ncbi:hypothetical protein JHK82_044787 [Glycine max]|nr:hypothetical protein JHK87_044979 [Glycine soja]KAG5099735.1 hypothetical protein JHK82_044787 [Glycine max]
MVFLQDVVCVTMGTITRIVMDTHSWCYPACIQCHRKTDAEVAPFTCGCGKENDQVVLRYRLEVMVQHNDGNTKFLLWDRECAELIGQSEGEVNRLKIELLTRAFASFRKEGDVDLNAFPQALDRLLGNFLAFRIRIQPNFRNFVALRCSNELDLINVVLDMLPDTKVLFFDVYCYCFSHSDIMYAFYFMQQSVSVTADHDPVARFSFTPKKRLSSNEIDDEAGGSQISPAQLSSNKLARHFDIR